MNIKTKFKPDDKVWVVVRKRHVDERCPECNKVKKTRPIFRPVSGVVDNVDIHVGYYRFSSKRRERKNYTYITYQVWCARHKVSKESDYSSDSRSQHTQEDMIFRFKEHALKKCRELEKEGEENV